jgi:2-keto-4-pentenoate hydratase/2-oxohepta-3-ene-1,7-dioic acid hydratase in catechol pathway
MGRGGRNIKEEEALSHVFGYATGNDFTARDLQRRSSQWMLGKSCDGFAVVGPWLVSADQVDPNNLKIALKVNGQTRQSSNTGDMVFNCQKLIAYISKHMTLKPGDIIFTGTPEGVINGMPKDKRVWLKAGDKIETTIEKLGTHTFTLT